MTIFNQLDDLFKGHFATTLDEFLSIKTKTAVLIHVGGKNSELFVSVRGNSGFSTIRHPSRTLNDFKLYDSSCNIGDVFSFANHQISFIKWEISCRSSTITDALVDCSRLESATASKCHSLFQIFSTIQINFSENNYLNVISGHQVWSFAAASASNYSHKSRYVFYGEQRYYIARQALG